MSISIQNTGRGFKVAYSYSDAATELGKTAFPGNFKWNAKDQTRDIEGQSPAIVGALKKWTAEATPHVEKAVQANVLSQKIIGDLKMADYPGIESVTATSNRIMIRLPNIPTATSTFMNAPFTGSFSYQPKTMQDGVEKGNYYYADPTKPGIADTLKAALTVASGHIAQAGERDIGISKIEVHPAMKLDVAIVQKTEFTPRHEVLVAKFAQDNALNAAFKDAGYTISREHGGAIKAMHPGSVEEITALAKTAGAHFDSFEIKPTLSNPGIPKEALQAALLLPDGMPKTPDHDRHYKDSIKLLGDRIFTRDELKDLATLPVADKTQATSPRLQNATPETYELAAKAIAHVSGVVRNLQQTQVQEAQQVLAKNQDRAVAR